MARALALQQPGGCCRAAAAAPLAGRAPRKAFPAGLRPTAAGGLPVAGSGHHGRPYASGSVAGRGRPLSRVAAAAGAAPGSDRSFELSDYVEVKVDHVQNTDKHGHIIFLKLMDDAMKVMPLYIGEAECVSLLKEMEKRNVPRPMTHDLMKSSLVALGFRVTKACITALVGNTYHGSLHYLKSGKTGTAAEEVVVDSRPSDAINLAVRFGAALYVQKDVAARSAVVMDSYALPREESKSEIIESVRRQVLHFNDPTYMHKLQLQLAIQAERYDEACKLRDEIDGIMTSNRELGLIVAMESALIDERFEEAAALRDELRRIEEHKAAVQRQKVAEPSEGY